MWGIWGLWCQPELRSNTLSIQYSVTGAPVAIGTYLSLTIGLGLTSLYLGVHHDGTLPVDDLLGSSLLGSTFAKDRIKDFQGPAHWLTMAIAGAASPGFIIASWQTYLVYWAYALLSLSINLPRTLEIVNYMLRAVIFTLNGRAIWLLVALLVRAYPKQSAHAVFIEFVNQSGWSSDGLVFFLALLPAYAAFAGLDNATHLTDELENPQKQSLLDPIGGQTMIQLMLNAFHSLPLTLATTAIMIYSFFVSSAASMITWSRLYWSFSREGSMPFSRTMSKLTSRDNLPIYAICRNTVLLIAIGAISIGSTTAMNALLGAANICIITAMVTAFALPLYKGRKTFDQNRWFNLGRWVAPASMDWACVVFGGVVVIATIYWLAILSRRRVSD
ncbi:hypothetical protein BDV34DRAFT_209264 [Aspergillus parasiticus]|uniref:Uncharacterized protein n=1 Tax=Aspergillus parasiticus TaxID=5067 RepID=A0A5N6E167_ASPPA|nr:hypothetical protein BDV34DRAFT_209264 [Aspergillus parasiticus]